MPYKDPEKRNAYYREYRKKQRKALDKLIAEAEKEWLEEFERETERCYHCEYKGIINKIIAARDDEDTEEVARLVFHL